MKARNGCEVNGLNVYGGNCPADSGGTGIVTTGGSGNTGGDGIDATGGSGNYLDTYGIYARPGNGPIAGSFQGNIDVPGTVETSGQNSKIDHPGDPANKYLVHASVQSSEMMNIYTGNVVTDELGLATVTLPEWFEQENGDFRYQLTVVGRKAQGLDFAGDQGRHIPDQQRRDEHESLLAGDGGSPGRVCES